MGAILANTYRARHFEKDAFKGKVAIFHKI